MCVPVSPLSGGSWGDCSQLDWQGIKSIWSEASALGEDGLQAVNDFCLDPQSSGILDHCVGMFRGCLSLAEIEQAMPGLGRNSFWMRDLLQGWAMHVPSLRQGQLEAW